jgi:hypothetical protein
VELTSPRTTSTTHTVDSYEDGIELFYARGWTDGHPVFLPTVPRVAAVLEALGRDPGEVIAESVERNRPVTVEKVAINSVMAGCLPEYVPVVIAAIEATMAPEFQHNHLASLGGPWPFYLVNGPIVDEIGLNADMYVGGPGHRSNSSIARAVSLVFWNCLDQKVGGVQRGAYGAPYRNESLIPERTDSVLEQLHVQRGFRPTDSTVTSFPGCFLEQILVHLLDTPEHILAPVTDCLSNGRFVWGPQLIVIPPNMAYTFHKAGWTKADMRAYLEEHTMRSIAGLKRRTRWAEQQAGRRPWDELLDVKPGDEETMITLLRDQPEYYDIAFRDKFRDSRGSDVMIVVSGGDSGPCLNVVIPYTESGPIPHTSLIRR